MSQANFHTITTYFRIWLPYSRVWNPQFQRQLGTQGRFGRPKGILTCRIWIHDQWRDIFLYIRNWNMMHANDNRRFTFFNPSWASLGWLDLILAFVLCRTFTEGGLLVSIYSAWSKMSWAPAAKCTPSPTASREILLRNAIVPKKNAQLLELQNIMKKEQITGYTSIEITASSIHGFTLMQFHLA